MPSVYAHYRFGFRMLPKLEPEVRKVINRNRLMYDVGLHGPDIFFYHNIFKASDLVRMGHNLHTYSGRQLLTRMAKRLRLEPSDAGLAYLYGLLAHYCLDVHCHPAVNAATAEAGVGHIRLETEFDRQLLVLDGKKNPSTFDCSGHLSLSEVECETVAALYPPVTGKDVKKSLATMAGVTRLLASDLPGLRTTAKKALGSGTFSQFIMFDGPDTGCEALIPPVMARYADAEAAFPAMAKQLTAHLTCGVPLGKGFEEAFV